MDESYWTIIIMLSSINNYKKNHVLSTPSRRQGCDSENNVVATSENEVRVAKPLTKDYIRKLITSYEGNLQNLPSYALLRRPLKYLRNIYGYNGESTYIAHATQNANTYAEYLKQTINHLQIK